MPPEWHHATSISSIEGTLIGSLVRINAYAEDT
jgi:hypothetical protein